MFFESWTGLLRIIVVGSACYIALILMLRVSGKRTLSKMNAFDLVVTVALGSTFATVVIDRSVPLADGAVALGLLIFLQYAITWMSVRSDRVQALVKSEPTLLVRDGGFLDDAMRRQRVSREEVLAAIREEGNASLEGTALVVLETDGTMSVIRKSNDA
ncbi:MAG: DUF421 domain-containing protein [Rhodospirillales bacterium]|nr:DUF421 domain-containing protein [Rhodospirillales bacterium]